MESSCESLFILLFPHPFFFSLYSLLLEMLPKNQQNTHRAKSCSLTIVVKIGTSSICNEVTHFPLLSNLSALVESVLHLRSQGHRVILVTSAAVGTGLRRLNMAEKPSKLSARQVRKIQLD